MVNKRRAFALLFALCFTQLVYGQSIKKIKRNALNTNKVTLAHGDSVQVFTLTSLKKSRTNGNGYYWWYGASSIKKTQGAIGGKVLHGEYSLFSMEKHLLERGHFQYGQRERDWRTWYPDGSLRSVVHWKNGLRHGSFIEYYPNGQVERKGSYRKERIDGKVKVYDREGKESVIRYKNGLPKIKKETENKREGRNSQFNENMHDLKLRLKMLSTPNDKHKTKNSTSLNHGREAEKVGHEKKRKRRSRRNEKANL